MFFFTSFEHINEDGAVTLEELQAAREEREEKVQRPKPGDVFAELDANGDGELTQDEVNDENELWGGVSMTVSF